MATGVDRKTRPRPRGMLAAAWSALHLAGLAAGSHADDRPIGEPRTPQAATSAAATEPAEGPASSKSRNVFGLDAAPLDEPLVTDRPDFTESTVTVPYGRAQIEAGYTYTYDSGDGVRFQDHTYPETLLRIGLVEDVELRLSWLGWSHSQETFRFRNDAGRRIKTTERDDGGNDVSVGFKFHLWDQDGLVPDTGVIVEASMPTGAAGLTSGDVDPAVKLLWAYDLTDDLALAGNVNVATPTADAGRFFQSSASVSLGYGITDRLGTYVEYFGFYPNDRNTADAHFANGGFTYLITDNFQLDIRAGVGLNDEADDFFTGVGFAFRF